jgi:Neocarzinostatin family
MSGVRIVRSRVAALTACLALLAGGVVLASDVGATTTPRLVVTPVSGLHNGSIVKVSGTGFKAGDTVFIVQCLWKSTGAAGCKIPASLPISKTISSTGKLAITRFKVTTGTIGNGKCGTKATNLKNCEVSVGNAAGGDSAVTRIQFVMPRG